VRWQDLEFVVGDQILLRVSLQKALCALVQLGKLVQVILDILLS
jgi:hypothetical protein